MTLHNRTIGAKLIDAPTPIEQAMDRLSDAFHACDRGNLKDALGHIREARIRLETEQQFRNARRGQA